MTRPARVTRHRQAAVVGIHARRFSKSIGITERHAGGLATLRFHDRAGTIAPCWTTLA